MAGDREQKKERLVRHGGGVYAQFAIDGDANWFRAREHRLAATVLPKPMTYPTLRAAVDDLAANGHLIRIAEPVDPHLEAAAIHRRVYEAGGPALLFENVTGCRFPMVSNLFGTPERTHFLFRTTLEHVKRLVDIKVDPAEAIKHPWGSLKAVPSAWSMRPKRVRRGPILDATCSLADLPQLVCWPDDGGAFVTLPQVYSEQPSKRHWTGGNLGMYRVQISGNDYAGDEAGLHYQLHRSIGVHHSEAIARGEPFPVTVFVGGPPALAVSAVMPLPEGLSEMTFAGALAGRRMRLVTEPDPVAALLSDSVTSLLADNPDEEFAGLGRTLQKSIVPPLPLVAEADFAICGVVQGEKPEGPFGDHLGYYARTHQFPCLKVFRVRHRKDAIWPFTVVGRPPQEDTAFGELIHELTGPAVPSVLPGVKAVHAVDAAGVHPLLLAIGSERYVPYAGQREPQELLTIANAILGQGQLSLAKYLVIAAQEDSPPNIEDIGAFFQHVLARIDLTRDLHFQTKTTIDTLDYSGSGFNRGSKVVIAAAGEPKRTLGTEVPGSLKLPTGFDAVKVVLPGVLAISSPKHTGEPHTGELPTDDGVLATFCRSQEPGLLDAFPLITLVDDAAFTAATLRNWLWVTFTRSNPAADISGIGAYTEQKHWGATGSVVIDARIKPHHAPPLIEDPAAEARVDELAASGGPLSGVL